MTGCTEKCWTPTPCPDHGEPMHPFGRSSGLDSYDCCENYARSEINPRHLWDEHDSTRWYTDPDGWNAHAESCTDDYYDCQPDYSKQVASGGYPESLKQVDGTHMSEQGGTP